MKIIKPSYEILTPIKGAKILKIIEKAGRTCYKSESRITETSAPKFVKMLINRKHLSVLEHESLSVRFIVDRGVSHELVRHRIASFSQESTRYCNYKDEVTFIDIQPHVKSDYEYNVWKTSIKYAERDYNALLSAGATPQIARSVLPNSLKTEIVVTANLREWRTILKQRTAPDAHPQMREVMVPLLEELRSRIPVVFDEL